ncbi:hypothetical protein ACJX0J_039679, partial [Zea mays]
DLIILEFLNSPTSGNRALEWFTMENHNNLESLNAEAIAFIAPYRDLPKEERQTHFLIGGRGSFPFDSQEYGSAAFFCCLLLLSFYILYFFPMAHETKIIFSET